ncbi:hypothetical protein WISP_05799 [Willisornis vidua]|uniref:Uncharacterized protein n=1 Tax=Willisornis vidua TaxID=1566151 RepID=A0ABQ9DT50_9PASS|nr:hypothetical protein WISP_05799 [Willisornis vidua]
MSPEEKPPPGRSRGDRPQPQPAAGRSRRRGGFLAEIRTPIRTEPFQQRYSLSPGRELGRESLALWGSTRGEYLPSVGYLCPYGVPALMGFHP